MMLSGMAPSPLITKIAAIVNQDQKKRRTGVSFWIFCPYYIDIDTLYFFRIFLIAAICAAAAASSALALATSRSDF
jgi:hypothetical protein